METSSCDVGVEEPNHVIAGQEAGGVTATKCWLIRHIGVAQGKMSVPQWIHEPRNGRLSTCFLESREDGLTSLEGSLLPHQNDLDVVCTLCSGPQAPTCSP